MSHHFPTVEGRLDAKGMRVALVVSRWNDLVSTRLLAGAEDCLERHGAKAEDCRVVRVPGSWEIPLAAHRLAASGSFDAVVALGALVRGETPHFDVLAAEVSKGLAQAAQQTGRPVIFGELESEGIRIEPSTLFLPSLLAPAGVLTRRKPNHREQRDIEFGWQLAKDFGNLDIGQCLLVKDQAVLAVEGIDGTDATILRGGRLCGQGALVIKVSKPSQDLRFDVPAVGLNTIQTMKRALARVLVVEAGRTLMFDRDQMIDAANAAGISIVGRTHVVDEGTTRSGLGNAHARTEPVESLQSSAPSLLIRHPQPDALRVGVVGSATWVAFTPKNTQLFRRPTWWLWWIPTRLVLKPLPKMCVHRL